MGTSHTPSSGAREDNILQASNRPLTTDAKKLIESLNIELNQKRAEYVACKELDLRLNTNLTIVGKKIAAFKKQTEHSTPSMDIYQDYDILPVAPKDRGDTGALNASINDMNLDLQEKMQPLINNRNKMANTVQRMSKIVDEIEALGVDFPLSYKESLEKVNLTVQDIKNKEVYLQVINICDVLINPATEASKTLPSSQENYFKILMLRNQEANTALLNNGPPYNLFKQSDVKRLLDRATFLFDMDGEISSDVAVKNLSKEKQELMRRVKSSLNDPQQFGNAIVTPPGGDPYIDGSRVPNSAQETISNPDLYFKDIIKIPSDQLTQSLKDCSDAVTYKKIIELQRLRDTFPGLTF